MIKIHAGKLRGQLIKRPNLATTKETASMVREAVFNSLYNVSGNVLDLFAGSGSYGFTALSLGASHIYLNEMNKVAFNNLKLNTAKLNVNNETSLTNKDYLEFLNNNQIIFDYIFLDPPFEFNSYELLLNKVSEFTNKFSLIILELDKKTVVINNFNNFTIKKNKTYGSKRIVIYHIEGNL